MTNDGDILARTRRRLPRRGLFALARRYIIIPLLHVATCMESDDMAL